MRKAPTRSCQLREPVKKFPDFAVFRATAEGFVSLDGQCQAGPDARPGGTFRAELSHSSMKIIERKIAKLLKEFDDLVELDMALAPEKKNKRRSTVGVWPLGILISTTLTFVRRT